MEARRGKGGFGVMECSWEAIVVRLVDEAYCRRQFWNVFIQEAYCTEEKRGLKGGKGEGKEIQSAGVVLLLRKKSDRFEEIVSYAENGAR